MTLNKACKELMEELYREDLSEEERRILDKYSGWLFTIKSTVTNNTEMLPFYEKCMTCREGGNHSVFWRPYPSETPPRDKDYLVTLSSGSIMIYSYNDHEGFPDNIGVIAWAELPKPYKKGK